MADSVYLDGYEFGVVLWECWACGAAVTDKQGHVAWHDSLRDEL